MRQSDTSQMFAVPFGDQADSSTITTIPQSKTAIGRASMALGFPKETFTPIAAGGVPPYGEDMNGILHMLAQAARAAEAGLVRPFSQNYANSINGYPLGAIVAHPSISGRYVMNTQDNNTAAPPGNGWIDPLFDFVTNEAMAAALQQETARAEAAEGAIFQLPAWVPIPCPLTMAPAGFLPADGRSFNTSQYPQLALGYPNGALPDLRGMFIRGLDTSGNVDNVPGGRQILSFEEGSLMARDYSGNVAGFGNNNSGNTATFQNINWDNITANNPNLGYVLEFAQSQAYLSGNQTSSTSQFVGVARPKNVAFNYIFRAA